MPARLPQVPRSLARHYATKSSQPFHSHVDSKPCFNTSRSRTSRAFHTTRPTRINDHYATLDLPVSAPASEVKKQFYKLSKTYHPDHNPSDPEGASKKFVAISEAYGTLGDPAKREKYDRDLERSRDGGRSRPGSYSSASGAGPGGGSFGSRRASGLSKRRAHFRGPPPSFYRSGGWGNASEKREANMGREGREAEARRQRQQQEHQYPAGGMGFGAAGSTGGKYTGTTGSWPFTDPNDVGHFDRESHYRTQSSIESQLRQGREKRRGSVKVVLDDTSEVSTMGNFLSVCAALGLGVGLPVLFMAKMGG